MTDRRRPPGPMNSLETSPDEWQSRTNTLAVTARPNVLETLARNNGREQQAPEQQDGTRHHEESGVGSDEAMDIDAEHHENSGAHAPSLREHSEPDQPQDVDGKDDQEEEQAVEERPNGFQVNMSLVKNSIKEGTDLVESIEMTMKMPDFEDQNAMKTLFKMQKKLMDNLMNWEADLVEQTKAIEATKESLIASLQSQLAALQGGAEQPTSAASSFKGPNGRGKRPAAEQLIGAPKRLANGPSLSKATATSSNIETGRVSTTVSEAEAEIVSERTSEKTPAPRKSSIQAPKKVTKGKKKEVPVLDPPTYDELLAQLDIYKPGVAGERAAAADMSPELKAILEPALEAFLDHPENFGSLLKMRKKFVCVRNKIAMAGSNRVMPTLSPNKVACGFCIGHVGVCCVLCLESGHPIIVPLPVSEREADASHDEARYWFK
ncbi:hypothetical protein LTR15_011677 [Elasticomyces elasticus]|nr:hypothetical protein LTR15_011677 [Elasticomyces elasticus]